MMELKLNKLEAQNYISIIHKLGYWIPIMM